MGNNNTNSNTKYSFYTVMFCLWLTLPAFILGHFLIFGYWDIFHTFIFYDKNFVEKIANFIGLYFMTLYGATVRYFLVAVAYWIILANLYKYMRKYQEESNGR